MLEGLSEMAGILDECRPSEMDEGEYYLSLMASWVILVHKSGHVDKLRDACDSLIEEIDMVRMNTPLERKDELNG
jgi:hypothetical protein